MNGPMFLPVQSNSMLTDASMDHERGLQRACKCEERNRAISILREKYEYKQDHYTASRPNHVGRRFCRRPYRDVCLTQLLPWSCWCHRLHWSYWSHWDYWSCWSYGSYRTRWSRWFERPKRCYRPSRSAWS